MSLNFHLDSRFATYFALPGPWYGYYVQHQSIVPLTRFDKTHARPFGVIYQLLLFTRCIVITLVDAMMTPFPLSVTLLSATASQLLLDPMPHGI